MNTQRTPLSKLIISLVFVILLTNLLVSGYQLYIPGKNVSSSIVNIYPNITVYVGANISGTGGNGTSDGNNYTSNIVFNNVSKTLTLTRIGMPDLVAGYVDNTGSGTFSYSDYFNQALNTTSNVTHYNLTATYLTATNIYITNPLWLVLANFTDLATRISNLNASEATKATNTAVTNNFTQVNTNIVNNFTQVNTNIVNNFTQANNNMLNNATKKANLTGAIFTGNIVAVNVTGNLTVSIATGIYNNATNYIIWNGTCWDIAMGLSHDYLCN